MDLEQIRGALAADLQAGLPGEISVYAYEQQTMRAPFLRVVAPTEGDHVEYYQSWAHGVQVIRWTLELRAGGRYEDALRTLDRLLSFGSSQPLSVAQALRNPQNLAELGVTVVVRNNTAAEPDDNGAGAFVPVELYPPKEVS